MWNPFKFKIPEPRLSDDNFEPATLLNEADTKDLIREILNSWSYQDLKDEELSEGDRIDRENTILGLHDKHLKPMLDSLLKQQIEYAVKNSETWDQVLFNRGTINGFDLLRTKLEDIKSAALERAKPKEEFNKYQIMPE